MRSKDGDFYLPDWVDQVIKWAWPYTVGWVLLGFIIPPFWIWILAIPILVLGFALYVEFQLDEIARREVIQRLKQEERSGTINS